MATLNWKSLLFILLGIFFQTAAKLVNSNKLSPPNFDRYSILSNVSIILNIKSLDSCRLREIYSCTSSVKI